VQRLDVPEQLDGRIEELHPAPSACRLRFPIGVRVPRATDVEAATDQVDIIPLQLGSLEGPQTRPEQQLKGGCN